MWQELEHYVGRRVTGTDAGDYALVPPGWNGDLPAGVIRLDVSTDKVWLWGRLRFSQGEDAAPVLALQKQFRLTPLSQVWKNRQADPATVARSAAKYRRRRSRILHATGRGGEDQRYQARGQGAVCAICPHWPDRGGLRRLKTQPPAPQGIIARAQGRTLGRDLGFPNGDGAAQRLVLGDGARRFWFRLSTARARVRAVSRDKAKKRRCTRCVIRFRRQTVGRRERLQVKFSSPPPVDAFWSLTVYNARDKLLVDNPIGRYKLGSDTAGLVTAVDGSITIKLTHVAPRERPRRTGYRRRRGLSIWCFAFISPGRRCSTGPIRFRRSRRTNRERIRGTQGFKRRRNRWEDMRRSRIILFVWRFSSPRAPCSRSPTALARAGEQPGRRTSRSALSRRRRSKA